MIANSARLGHIPFPFHECHGVVRIHISLCKPSPTHLFDTIYRHPLSSTAFHAKESLDANASLAPVSSLSVVARIQMYVSPKLQVIGRPVRVPFPERGSTGVLEKTHRIVLPVRRRIHWGIGRFCFWALASFCFVRKDLWDCSNEV